LSAPATWRLRESAALTASRSLSRCWFAIDPAGKEDHDEQQRKTDACHGGDAFAG
jgi:hypothetical protein